MNEGRTEKRLTVRNRVLRTRVLQKLFKSVNFEVENYKKPWLGVIHGWNKLVLASANYVSGPLKF